MNPIIRPVKVDKIGVRVAASAAVCWNELRAGPMKMCCCGSLLDGAAGGSNERLLNNGLQDTGLQDTAASEPMHVQLVLMADSVFTTFACRRFIVFGLTFCFNDFRMSEF